LVETGLRSFLGWVLGFEGWFHSYSGQLEATREATEEATDFSANYSVDPAEEEARLATSCSTTDYLSYVGCFASFESLE
jgi:hypothetical protein